MRSIVASRMIRLLLVTSAQLGVQGVTGKGDYAAYKGSSEHCSSGLRHKVVYNVQHKVSDSQIFNLEENSGVQSVICDIDQSRIQIQFTSRDGAQEFSQNLNQVSVGSALLVAGQTHGCPVSQRQTSGTLMRRVLSSSMTDQGSSVVVMTSQLQYSEVYEKAQISYNSKPDPSCSLEEGFSSTNTSTHVGQPEHGCPTGRWCCEDAQGAVCVTCPDRNMWGLCLDTQAHTCSSHNMQPAFEKCGDAPSPSPAPSPPGKKVCLGINTNDCESAKAPIPLYSTSSDIPHGSGNVAVTCDNCFVGFESEVFFDLGIEAGLMNALMGGFKNTAVSAELSLGLNAEARWGVSIDKEIWSWSDAGSPVINFKIGPIPFMLWFETSARFTGDFTISANGQASAGVSMKYSLGDNYLNWDDQTHWQKVSSDPSLVFTPHVTGSATVDANAHASLVPSVALHVNQLFSTSLTLTPVLSMDVTAQGDIKTGVKICENAKYHVDLSADAQVHIDMLMHLIKIDKEFGPTTIWQKDGTLSQACVPALSNSKISEQPVNQKSAGSGEVLV